MRTGDLTRRDCLVGMAGWAAVPASWAYERTGAVLFGTPVTLLLPDGAGPRCQASVMASLATMNSRWNAWKPGDVSALNAAFRGGRAARTTPELISLIRGAARMEVLSGGHFNAGIGGLVGAWGFHGDRPMAGPRPAVDAVQRWTARRPSLAQIEVRGLEVRSRESSLQLDFGAYAKGVAIDFTLDRLQRAGVAEALLDLGGNLAAVGQPAGRPWMIGIRDPFGPGLVARLATRGREAVVTSGTYERWRLAGDEVAGHVLDPSAGTPAQGLVSATVVHPSAAWADAAATALLVAGPSRWANIAERMGVTQAMVIDSLGRRAITPALASRMLPA